MTAREVVVIGGGLAGITAAMDLREAGHQVTLLESRSRLGGAASSYARGSMTVDNGQHVFLRCCTAYRDLLGRLGVSGQVHLQDKFDVTVLAPGGKAARLRRNSLPSPLHLAGALAGYKMLSAGERARVGRAALAFRFADPASPDLDRYRLGDWLAAHGQGERARRRLWDLFVVSTLNVAGDEASVPLAATVVKTGLLGARDAADIGIAAVPLGELHGTAAAAVLAELGVKVRLGARAETIERLPGGGFRIGLTPERSGDAGEDTANDDDADTGPARQGGPSLSADAVVLAVPAERAARLAAAAGLAESSAWSALGHSPIINVHVLYDREVTKLPFAAAVDSPVQWVFDKTRQAGLTAGQYLAVSLSAADDYVDMSVAALRELFLPALEQLFPAAADAGITDFFVTRERRATFRQVPGSGALRPGAGTSVPGLALAGAWTDTGWPDTMEGAVRSGHHAAQDLTSQLAWLPAASPTAALDTARTGAP
jgi:squalene-associated FAD-dependent desaturase